MPGYLSNRLISFMPVSKEELEALDSEITLQISTVNNTLTEMQGDIEDIQLNIGV
jgi:hypothetical protein